ncbi:T/G mismatch-specific endonuclease [Blastococcus fimeti]|nr:T/G mismatch-specific endonuclease [Blastococcus fimeti]
MHQPPPVVHRGVFRGSDVLRRGVLTRGQLRTSAYRRLRPDVYVLSTVPVTHRLHAEAVALVAPPAAVFGGHTAAALWGGQEFAGPADPVEVVLPTGIRWHASGVHVRTASLAGAVVGDGLLRWTDRTRTALDLVRRGSLDEAVVRLDHLVRAGICDLAAVRSAAAALPRCRGSRQAREAAGLADGLAESPPESRLRLLMRRGGLPAPVPQFEVRADGAFVARVDFAYPEHRLAIEYDGLWHAEPGQFARDRRRLNRLSAAGWRVVFVTAADLHRPEELVRRIADALRG